MREEPCPKLGAGGKRFKLTNADASLTELGGLYNKISGGAGLDSFRRGTTERNGRTYAQSGKDVRS